MKYIIAFLALFLLTSCDQNESNIDQKINRESLPIKTTVHFYNNVEEVRKKYRELNNLDKDQEVLTEGFAIWPEWKDQSGNSVIPEGKELRCDIYTVRPSKIDDEAVLTLGHEMLHCVYGKYHSEGRIH